MVYKLELSPVEICQLLMTSPDVKQLLDNCIEWCSEEQRCRYEGVPHLSAEETEKQKTQKVEVSQQ
jgi:hypothetical protein